MGRDEDKERVREACQTLGEYFDSVQIFATRHDVGGEGGTVHITEGEGNWFARYGQVIDWVEAQREGTRISIRRKIANDEKD